MNPYRIEGPAVISFSGGRTSAFMLRKILDAHDGALPADVHVLFQNTGREREETLRFIHECQTRWGVPVRWLERQLGGAAAEVTFETASRNGEPFDVLLAERDAQRWATDQGPDLPGFGARWCSVELKALTMRAWMLAAGCDSWTNVLGIRYDEPRRWAKYLGKSEKEWDFSMPLYEDRVTKRQHVRPFWATQPFDLGLEDYEGNCDFCMLKSIAATRRLLREQPDRAQWWIDHETRTGMTFRRDRPSLAALQRVDDAQARLFIEKEEAAGSEAPSCLCDLEAA